MRFTNEDGKHKNNLKIYVAVKRPSCIQCVEL